MRSERPSHPTPVEDYTNAFLATFGVIVFMVLFAIWAIWGLIVAGVVSWVADRLMAVGSGRRRSS
ncbi:MAG: hypothetical protein ACR2O1_14365 [Boseongicola sp.]